ncbi:hypothetical protein NX059_000026 [Plenodomus lindquistii]|nr:hypothetical protein NX059_000026 [Plenodomus lindquistii]
MPDVDTSNAWVYEGFSAATLHGLLWLSLRAWGYNVTLIDQAKDMKRSVAFMSAFTGPGVVVLVLMAFGVVLMIPTMGEVLFRPNRDGLVWLARFFTLGYGTAGRVFRLSLTVITSVIVGLIWMHAIQEVKAVTGGRTGPWNLNWKQPNPTADTFFGVILSLWG